MKGKNNIYSIEFKINTIERYNSGDEGGVKSLSKKLGFRSHNMLSQWLKKYNEFGIAGLEDKRGKTTAPMRGRPQKHYDSLEEEVLKLKVIRHYGRYGVERMTEALSTDYGLKLSHKKVYRLMSQNGYLAVIKARKKYKKPGEPHPKKNALVRDFSTSCPFDKMVTDVTEYKINGKKIYISAVKDIHTGMLEGFSVKNHQTRQLIRESFKNILDRSLPEGTIIHSDQGDSL